MSKDNLNKDSAKSGLWFGYLSTSNSSKCLHPHFREQRQGITYITDLQYYFPKIFFILFGIKPPMHFKPQEHTKYQNVSAVMKVRKIICVYGLALISKLSRSWHLTCILKEKNHFFIMYLLYLEGIFSPQLQDWQVFPDKNSLKYLQIRAWIIESVWTWLFIGEMV